MRLLHEWEGRDILVSSNTSTREGAPFEQPPNLITLLRHLHWCMDGRQMHISSPCSDVLE